MNNFEDLVKKLQRSPSTIQEIEKQVELIASTDDFQILLEMKNSQVPGMHIFLCKIIELKIKRKITTLDLIDEINFVSMLLESNPSYQVLELYTTLGLYCWHARFPDFMNKIISLLNCQIGYKLLLSFLEKVNLNSTIDEKRRSELKKAIFLISNSLFENFKSQFAPFIINIYVEMLKILPKNFDHSLVFDMAPLYPDEALNFVIEGFPYIDHNKVSDILEYLPSDHFLIQTLTNIKLSKISYPEKVFNYVFKSSEYNLNCLIAAIDFWSKTFTSRSEGILSPVLTEILRVYLQLDDTSKEDVDQHIFGFFSIICRNYPKSISQFISLHGNNLPIRIVYNFIQKLSKSDPSSLTGLTFSSYYLNVQLAYLMRDPNTPNMMLNLDFKDKDQVKLAVSILSDYNFTSDQLLLIAEKCNDACINANEIRVDCCVKLNIHEQFEEPWNIDKIIKYFYFMKRQPAEYSKYGDSFYRTFINNHPFDRCFSIIEKLGNIPSFILQDIYSKMDKYPFIEITCFNNDLLKVLPEYSSFVQKEVYRFVSEWDKITDHVEYYQAVTSLLTYITGKMTPGCSPDFAEYLIDLIPIDSPIILNKVLSLLDKYKGPYNTKKALYFLIASYNSPNLSNSFHLISSAITDCLFQEDGPVCFNMILGLDLNRVYDIKAQITKVNRKTAQNIVRDLIKDFKGKPFNKMFEDEFKVTLQHFLPKVEKPHKDDSNPNMPF